MAKKRNMGVSPSGSGQSAEPEPVARLRHSVTVPNAALPPCPFIWLRDPPKDGKYHFWSHSYEFRDGRWVEIEF